MPSELQGRLAALQQSLALPRPPIGLAFLDGPPAGLPRPDRAVPSACSFWRMAERAVFYAEAAEHLNCPIGTHTMGFPIPEERRAEAEALIGTLCDLEYISQEEVAAIPSVEMGHAGILYGPVGQMPVEPDVVLLFCRPGPAMLLLESSGYCSWAGQGVAAFGRPTCAAVSFAVKTGNPSTSVGCVGFRVYTGLPDEEMILAFPRSAFQGLLDRMETIIAANSTLEEFHTRRRAAF